MSIRTIPRPYAYKAAPITPADKERLILDYAPTIKYIAQRVAAHRSGGSHQCVSR
jgi:hypothetical protein